MAKKSQKFAEFLKLRMASLGLNNTSLAALAGVSNSIVGDWKDGTIPRPQTLKVLAGALRISERELHAIAYEWANMDKEDDDPVSPIRAAIERELDEIEDEELLELILDQLQMVLKPHGSRMLKRAEQKAKENATK